ncbi:MAG: hypothetical protein LUH15_01815 [Tannerellaceae bacterium]|nr:hypothetical protein [Tannerellaceae bacterium]
MLKINRLIVAGILIFSQFSLLAQNNTNSPYTRYGYGSWQTALLEQDVQWEV